MIVKESENKISPLVAWLGIIVTFVFALFFMLATFVPDSQSALSDNISGWGWSPLLSGTLGSFTGSGFGLVSFNDCYCFYQSGSAGYICQVNIDQPCVSDKGLGYAPYGLQVDLQTREITGWAWGQGVGWICFGQSCCNAGGGKDYCNDWKGGEWEPNNINPDSGVPEITVSYPADQDPAPISGWAKIVGWSGLGDGQLGWISLRGRTTDDGSEYGLRFSTSTLEIRGLGWGAIGIDGWYDPNIELNKSLPMAGYGWLCINEDYRGPNPVFERGLCPRTGVQVAVPYIQTVDGDVYSQTNIAPDLSAPSGKFNATYLIMAGGNIQNFSSEEKSSTFNQGEYTIPNFPYSISLPKASTNFFNVLGRLDIPGIVQPKENRYGNFESHTGDLIISGTYSRPNYRVVVDGDLTLGADVAPGSFTYSLTTDWNYISPVIREMDGQLIKDLFTNIDGDVYTYTPSPVKADYFEIGKGYIFKNKVAENITVNGTPIVSLRYSLSGGTQYTIGAPFDMNFQGVPCLTDVLHYNPYPPPTWISNWNVAKGEGVWVETINSSTCQFTKNRTDVSVEFTGGATTFVVYGDLHINRNVKYTNELLSSFKNLPSVAYIVFGDVYIDSEVTEIDGNFIVLGQDGVNCPSEHCGTIYTGAGKDFPLQVNGIMMAKNFVFQRNYATVLKDPAERVIYDGRLLINTPPGLQDFAKGLPIWSEVAPN